MEQLNTILAKVDNLVDALNTGKGSIGMLINDPSLYNRAVATLNEIYNSLMRWATVKVRSAS